MVLLSEPLGRGSAVGPFTLQPLPTSPQKPVKLQNGKNYPNLSPMARFTLNVSNSKRERSINA